MKDRHVHSPEKNMLAEIQSGFKTQLIHEFGVASSTYRVNWPPVCEKSDGSKLKYLYQNLKNRVTK